MEINGNIPAIKIDAYMNGAKEKAGPKGSSSNKVTESVLNNEDTVKISQNARNANGIKEQVDLIPDIREEKVAELKSRIEQGTYQVDGKKIAFKMIRESLIDEIV